MAMNQRLLRPRAAFHPEAANWAARVQQAGGSASGAMLSAVSKFCRDIDAAGIRNRFARLNLFAGNGLNACIVPLYRGLTQTGTQYGNLVDDSLGSPSFGEQDYNEKGASGGLQGDGNHKYLDTGVSPSDYQATASTGHISVYHSQPSGTNVGRVLMGANSSSNFRRFYISSDIFSSSAVAAFLGGTATATQSGLGSQTGAPSGHRVLSRTGTQQLTHYVNAASVATSETNISGADDAIADKYFIFARNNNGSATQWNNGRILAYSIGLSLDAQQVTAFYNAMQAFQTALERQL